MAIHALVDNATTVVPLFLPNVISDVEPLIVSAPFASIVTVSEELLKNTYCSPSSGDACKDNVHSHVQ